MTHFPLSLIIVKKNTPKFQGVKEGHFHTAAPISSMKDNAERGSGTEKENGEKISKILEGKKERLTRSVVKRQNKMQSTVGN